MEAAERVLMSSQDELGWAMRETRNNALIIAREFEGMRRAEIAQTRIDAFWGIPTYQAARAAEEAERQRKYNEKVQKMHGLCLKAGIVAPSEEEREALEAEMKEAVFGGSRGVAGSVK